MKLYYFSAPWCGPCKVLGPQMEKSGLPYTKVNVDSDTEL
jgi:thiol-disulfide isomerase/thioredoxin